MRASGALPFVFRSYLTQGIAAGALMAVVMPTLAAQGMKLEAYAEMSGLGLLPWCLKLAWAPAIDRYARADLQRLRRWVALAQLITGASTLAAMALWQVRDPVWGWGLLWFVINTGMAAQDTAADAAVIAHIAPERRSAANALMLLGHAVGASVIAGWAFGHLARALELRAVGCAVAVSLLLIGGFEHWSSSSARTTPRTPSSRDEPNTSSSASRSAFVFAALVAGTALITQAITSTAAVGFLFQRLKWTALEYQQELYPISTLVTLVAYALWSRGLVQLSARKVLMISSVALGGLWMALGLIQGWWDSWGHPLIWVYAVLETLATTAWTASLYAVLMGASQGPHRALRFAGLMALLNLSRLGGTLLAPKLLNHLSFGNLWIVMGVVLIVWALVATFYPRTRQTL